VRPDEADGDEEGLVGFCRRRLKPARRLAGKQAVGVKGVVDLGEFRGRAARTVATLAQVGRAFRQRVGRRLGIPVRHAPRGGVLDVAMAAMEDLAHGLGAIALRHEVLGHRHRVGDGLAEVRAQFVDAQGLRPQAGHQGIARG